MTKHELATSVGLTVEQLESFILKINNEDLQNRVSFESELLSQYKICTDIPAENKPDTTTKKRRLKI